MAKQRLDFLDLNNVSADAVTYEATSSTVDTYKYRKGGVSGSIVLTLTITYTDTTKEQVSSVVKS
jgi:hypothetical protein